MPDPVPLPIRLKFWGVRGSVPVPGLSTASIGGNTACVELRADGDIFILDAGTGIRSLGLALEEEFRETPLTLTLLISHTHWDHIQGLPFFQPAYRKQNCLRIFGPNSPSKSLPESLGGQMESVYFPVAMTEWSADVNIAGIMAPEFSVGRVKISVGRVNHPGTALGYRLQTDHGAIVYIPDCEPAGWNSTTPSAHSAGSFLDATGTGLADFIRGAEILIFDGQYDRREYAGRAGWGHACLEDTVELAMAAGVKQLYIFHHDPGHNDECVMEMLATARRQSEAVGSPLKIEVAREGLEVLL